MKPNQNTKLKQAGFAYRVGLFAQKMSHIKLPGLNQEYRMIFFLRLHTNQFLGYWYIMVLIHKPVKTQDTDVLENDTFALLFDAV